MRRPGSGLGSPAPVVTTGAGGREVRWPAARSAAGPSLCTTTTTAREHVNETLPGVWNDRDLPVLTSVVRRIDATGDNVHLADVQGDTWLSEDDVVRAGTNLKRAGLVKVVDAAGFPVIRFVNFSDDALWIVGLWPTAETALDRMNAALQAIAENTEADEDTRTRARKVLDGLTGGAKSIGLSVAAAAITGQLPGQ